MLSLRLICQRMIEVGGETWLSQPAPQVVIKSSHTFYISGFSPVSAMDRYHSEANVILTFHNDIQRRQRVS